jgi:regulator of nonsense transcripts 2
MKSQKEAERVERQNIKNLVLNYDLHDSSVDSAGTAHHFYFPPFPPPNPNIRTLHQSRPAAHYHLPQGPVGEKHAPAHQSSSRNVSELQPVDKSATNRSGHRARKLQLSDVEWYESKPGPSHRDKNHGKLQRIAG